MDWIRANKSLAGILGAAIAGALGLGVILYFTYDAYATSADSLKTASGKIAKMESSKLYPSEANVEAKEEKVSAYEDEVSKLGTVLLALQSEVASKPITDTDFQAKLKQRIAEVRDRSKEALPKDFAFGFNIYTSSLPPSEATPDLNEYLDGVDSIVTAALDAGVKKIETISRSDLGVEKGAGKPKKVLAPAKPKAATTKSKKKGAKDNKPVKAPVEIAQMVERRLVTLDIEADQAPLQTFINTLASATLMKHFTVLRVLRIENERQEGPPSKAAPTTGANGLKTLDSNGLVSAAPVETEKLPVEGAAPAPKVEVITAAKAAPPDAVKVLGGELLKAHLEIDLVRFLEPEPESTAGGTVK